MLTLKKRSETHRCALRRHSPPTSPTTETGSQLRMSGTCFQRAAHGAGSLRWAARGRCVPASLRRFEGPPKGMARISLHLAFPPTSGLESVLALNPFLSLIFLLETSAALISLHPETTQLAVFSVSDVQKNVQRYRCVHATRMCVRGRSRDGQRSAPQRAAALMQEARCAHGRSPRNQSGS